jgi:hypothetical protein
MIVTIEVKPELAHRWKAIAEREGRALEAVAAQAAEAGTDAIESAQGNPIARALALLDELAPVIRAGTRNDGVPFDAAADVRAMREERFADAA